MSGLDPMAMLLDAARFIEGDKPAWAKAAREAVKAFRRAPTVQEPDLRSALHLLDSLDRIAEDFKTVEPCRHNNDNIISDLKIELAGLREALTVTPTTATPAPETKGKVSDFKSDVDLSSASEGVASLWRLQPDARTDATIDQIAEEHLAWLSQYFSCMTGDNWRDMRAHGECQVQKLRDHLAAPPARTTARTDEPLANYCLHCDEVVTTSPHCDRCGDPTVESAASTLYAAPPSPDTVREQIARILDTYGWNWLDGVVRPFAENRGTQEGDQCEFYGMAWHDGVRTAVEARDWCLNKAKHTVRHSIVQSLIHADAILAGPLAALSSAPVAPAAPVAGTKDQWQEISTAPKDGTEILAYSEHGGTGTMLVRHIAVCDFLTDAEIEKLSIEGMSDADIETPDWFHADFLQGGRLSPDCYPTQWQALPLPRNDRGSQAQ